MNTISFSPVAAIVSILLGAPALDAQAGGTVNFGNNSSNKIINAHSGVAITAAENVKVALYWLPPASDSFVQLGSSVLVGVPLDGIFVGGTRTTGEDTPGGTSAKFQVRAWDGAYATYKEAALQPGVVRGLSAVFVNPTGNSAGAPPAPPESLLAGGFAGFVVSTNAPPPALYGLSNKTVPCDSSWAFDVPAATDSCTASNLTASVVATVTNGPCPVTITRTWSVTNSCDTNFAMASQTITLSDTVAPVISCLGNKLVRCGSEWAFDEPAAIDACSGTNLNLAILATVTNEVCPLVVTRVWRASDACGNSSLCSQTITVAPAAPPSLACATNKIVMCTNQWDFDSPIALDACGSNSVPVEIIGTFTNSLCPLSLTRSWRATNDCAPEGVTCSQTVTVLCPSCPVLQLTLACPANPVPPGGTLAWTGTITNGGDITVSNVVVVNDQPAPNTLVFGPVTLAPGEGASFAGSYSVPAASGPYADTLSATGVGPDGVVFTMSASASCPGASHVTAGDMNGDGIVSQSELNAVLANYWAHSEWVTMTNAALLCDGRFQFSLTNAGAWGFTVLVSTNLVDWTNLPAPAIPVFQFVDPEGTNAPQRLYRLQWP